MSEIPKENHETESAPDKKTTMRIVCAWCGKDLGTKEVEGGPEGQISHGICDECKKKALEDIPEEETKLDNEVTEKEVSPEFAKEVEDSRFRLEDKINILLVKAGLKPAATISLETDISLTPEMEEVGITDAEIKKMKFPSKEEEDKAVVLIENSGLFFVPNKNSEFKYSEKINDGRELFYQLGHTSYYIASSQENLDLIIRAVESEGDDELMGRAFGFHPTAAEAFAGKRKKLDRTKIPNEIFESEAMMFTPGVLSENNWQEEIKQGQVWANFIKKISPKLYRELMGLPPE